MALVKVNALTLCDVMLHPKSGSSHHLAFCHKSIFLSNCKMKFFIKIELLNYLNEFNNVNDIFKNQIVA